MNTFCQLKLIIIFFLLLFVGSCENKDNSENPEAITGTAVVFNDGRAIVNGIINPNGSWTRVSFQYGVTTLYGNEVKPAEDMYSGFLSTEVEVEISELQRNVLYHYRIVAENEVGKVYGNDGTFIILISCKLCQQRTYEGDTGYTIYEGDWIEKCGEELIIFESIPDVTIGNSVTVCECR